MVKGKTSLERMVLQHLLSSSGRGKNARPAKKTQSKPAWDCQQCQFHNFGFRSHCLKCGKAKGSKKPAQVVTACPSKSSAGVLSKTPPLAPWAKPQVAANKMAALQASLSMLRQHGGDEDVETVLQSWIAEAEKASASKEKPLAERLAGTRAYIVRAEKRREAAQLAVSEAQARLSELETDLAQHKSHLASLEREALVTLQPGTPTVGENVEEPAGGAQAASPAGSCGLATDMVVEFVGQADAAMTPSTVTPSPAPGTLVGGLFPGNGAPMAAFLQLLDAKLAPIQAKMASLAAAPTAGVEPSRVGAAPAPEVAAPVLADTLLEAASTVDESLGASSPEVPSTIPADPGQVMIEKLRGMAGSLEDAEFGAAVRTVVGRAAPY